ncbi:MULTISPECIES: hypothetical protein [Pseudoalteromonas]|uniref:hypothetical protein n=1 Tax=Pseudoalteromonas TaxID=53246 RepID=UPI0002EC617B|nr:MULTISPECIES: hypothetical protein [Pseudoalteromonas]WMO14360.1 hypothetical protein NI376_01565 [Pseudoalteromonas piscicida]
MKNQKNTQKSLSSADLAKVVGGNGSGNDPTGGKPSVKNEGVTSVGLYVTTELSN